MLCWGYGGILSLGQGVFFGLGGYCMAMFLKLEASDVVNTKIQSTPGIPDFMDWNQITELPLFWMPFNSLPFTLLAVIVVPALLAFILGVAMFKRRVGGVYFAIITQAMAAILSILIVGRQGYTGGINGITDLQDAARLGHPHRRREIHPLLRLRLPAARLRVRSRARAVEQARPPAGGHARQGGPGAVLRLRRRQLQDIRVLPGGRHVRGRWRDVHAAGRFHVAFLRGHRAFDRDGDLLPRSAGAVVGRRRLRHALVNFGKTFFSERFPDLWLFLMGGLFIAVVLVFPDGLAGLVDRSQLHAARLRKLGDGSPPTASAQPGSRRN